MEGRAERRLLCLGAAQCHADSSAPAPPHLAVLLLLEVGAPAGDLIPHCLHLEKVVGLLAVAGEQRRRRLAQLGLQAGREARRRRKDARCQDRVCAAGVKRVGRGRGPCGGSTAQHSTPHNSTPQHRGNSGQCGSCSLTLPERNSALAATQLRYRSARSRRRAASASRAAPSTSPARGAASGAASVLGSIHTLELRGRLAGLLTGCWIHGRGSSSGCLHHSSHLRALGFWPLLCTPLSGWACAAARFGGRERGKTILGRLGIDT